MDFVGRPFAEIVDVWLFSELGLHLCHHLAVCFFEHLGELALASTFRAIGTVVLNMVNKEETEDLDTLEEEGTLTLKVGADGFLYLDTAHNILADLADSISFVEFQTIEKTDGTFYAIDAFYNEVLFVLGETTRLLIEVITFLYKGAFMPC